LEEDWTKKREKEKEKGKKRIDTYYRVSGNTGNQNEGADEDREEVRQNEILFVNRASYGLPVL
jgi:hypothetical protein